MNKLKNVIARKFIGTVLTLLALFLPVGQVYADVSVSIQSLSPGSTVTVGSNVSFTALPTGFFDPSYTVSDSFAGGTVSSSNIIPGGAFSWTPVSSDIGTHDITVTVTDPYGNNATVHQEIVVNPTPTPTPSPTPTPTPTLSPTPTLDNLSASILSPNSRFVFTKTLSQGAVGKDVTELQKRLSSEGLFGGPINGRFGPLTKAAVKKYQTKHKITPLGNVGPGTRAVLNK
jgi:hypothetical protein